MSSQGHYDKYIPYIPFVAEAGGNTELVLSKNLKDIKQTQTDLLQRKITW